MKPETVNYLEAAETALKEARQSLAANIPRQAARIAYYAQFHAAQALIFERMGKAAKTHRGAQNQFHKLVKDEGALDPQLGRQLKASYNIKQEGVIAEPSLKPTLSE